MSRPADTIPSPNAVLLAAIIVVALLLAALVWLAGDILALFVISFFLAYIFDPLARFLCCRGLSRGWAAAAITVTLVILLALAAAVLGPLLFTQLEALFKSLRQLMETESAKLTHELAPYIPALRHDGLMGTIQKSQPVDNLAAPLAASVWSGGKAFASLLPLVLLAPLITFYLLKGWPAMMTRILAAVPPRRRPAVRDLAAEIDAVLSAFLHGQAWVCLCDAVLFSIGLLASGLDYAMVIGVIAGLLKFFPFIGTLIGLCIAIAMAVSQGASWWVLLGIGLTFAFVETIENGILYPRLVGRRVRLPAALVIFAVLVGVKLMGVLGVFLAVPACAVGRVVIAFWFRSQVDQHTEAPAPAALKPRTLADRRRKA